MPKIPQPTRFNEIATATAILLLLAAPISFAGADTEPLDLELERKLEEFDRAIGRQNSSDEVDILSQKGRNMPLDHGSAFDEIELGELHANMGIGDEDDSIVGRAGRDSGSQSGSQSPGSNGDGGQQSGSAGREGDSGGAQDRPSGDGSGGAGQASIPLPDDIDDGQGDDIVLRQIREAAMREQDPLLREKLWEEYRRIKGQ